MASGAEGGKRPDVAGIESRKKRQKHPTRRSRCPNSRCEREEGMYGTNRTKLILIRCVCCHLWQVVRVDPEDLDRHLGGGVFVQHAFVNKNGTPYLSPAERELFISACCGSCWSLLMPASPMAYN